MDAPRDIEILVFKDGRWNFANWVTPETTDVPKAMYIDREGFCMDDFEVWHYLPRYET